VNKATKLTIEIGGALFSAAVAFCLGFFGGQAYSAHWIVPGSPKGIRFDGQIGLAYGLVGGVLAAIFVFLAGMIWIVKTSLAKRNPNRMNTLPSR